MLNPLYDTCRVFVVAIIGCYVSSSGPPDWRDFGGQCVGLYLIGERFYTPELEVVAAASSRSTCNLSNVSSQAL